MENLLKIWMNKIINKNYSILIKDNHFQGIFLVIYHLFSPAFDLVNPKPLILKYYRHPFTKPLISNWKEKKFIDTLVNMT